MKIGILADVHEDVERLVRALDQLQQEQVARIVVLGDVCESGSRLGETVKLLAGAGAVGVWGNHDLGLCHEPGEELRARYAGPVLEYLSTLQPRLAVEDCLFTHGLPYWDPTDPFGYYLEARPETDEGRLNSFQASTSRITFVGHFHRWLAATPDGYLPWAGSGPLLLPPDRRFLVVVAAVCDGWCAVFDTVKSVLVPYRLPGSTRSAASEGRR